MYTECIVSSRRCFYRDKIGKFCLSPVRQGSYSNKRININMKLVIFSTTFSSK